MSQKEIELIESEISGRVDMINPFPGLRPFGFEESHLFFGREGQSDEVLMNLARHRFTAVIGASGSGKSSLMFCGLIPILYGGFMTQAGSDWNVIVTRPGISPIDNLAESIVLKDEDIHDVNEEDLNISKTLTSTILRSSSMGLVDAVKQNRDKETKNIFILVDQFEELFRYINSENDVNALNEAAAFVNLLIKSISQAEVPVYIALTMRSDFIGECSQFPELTHIINKSHYLIPQMTRDQQRLAIEGPVAVGGGVITKRLVQQLLNDVGNNPDQLPVLQHALMRTWDYWINNKESEEPIDLRHYIAIGRINEALSQHANEAYSELNKRQKEICEILFKTLTEKSADNIGIRRSAKLSEVAEIAGASEDEVIEIVEVFRQPGRSLLMPPTNVALNSESIIEISHESLMRIWQRLKTWVDEEADSANMYRRLSDAAEMYQVGKTGLWRPPDLQLAINWQRKQNPTATWAKRYNPYFERAMLFLEISKEAYENEQRSKEMLQKRMLQRTKAVALVLGLAAIVSSFFFVYGWIQKNKAEENAQEAYQNFQLAQENAELAEKKAQEANQQRMEAEEQRQAAERQEEIAKLNEQEAIQQKTIAVRERQRAEEQTQLALTREQQANEAKEEAQEQREIAQNERDRALALRMLSISQSMAVKSLYINEDKDLKGLLAQQAFKYNQEYGGNTYDNYIYDGLYYAMKSIEGEGYNILEGHTDNVRAIVSSQDGSKFYTTGSDGKVLVWDAGERSYQTLYKHDFVNKHIALSQDERYVIIAGDAPYVLLLDLEDLKSVKLEGHEGPVASLVVPQNGDHFYTAGIEDRKLIKYDYVSAVTVREFDARVTSMSLTKDEKYLVTGSESGNIKFWNATDYSLHHEAGTITQNPVYALESNNNGNILAIGDESGVIYLCDVSNGPENLRMVLTLTGQDSRISEISFSPDGALLATASLDGSVQIWEMNNLQNLPIVLKDHKDHIWGISFNREGDYLLSGVRNGDIKLWPTRPSILADKICNKLMRNMTRREWERYVGKDIEYRKTCEINN